MDEDDVIRSSFIFIYLDQDIDNEFRNVSRYLNHMDQQRDDYRLRIDRRIYRDNFFFLTNQLMNKRMNTDDDEDEDEKKILYRSFVCIFDCSIFAQGFSKNFPLKFP